MVPWEYAHRRHRSIFCLGEDKRCDGRFVSADETGQRGSSGCSYMNPLVLLILLLWVIVIPRMLVEGQWCILKPMFLSSDGEWQRFELQIGLICSWNFKPHCAYTPLWRAPILHVSTAFKSSSDIDAWWTVVSDLSRCRWMAGTRGCLLTQVFRWRSTAFCSFCFHPVCRPPFNKFLHGVLSWP